jgi:hypothetical protein
MLAVAAALSLSATALAAGNGISGDHSPGRPSVTPPPWSHGHCGHTDLRPPCNIKH